MTTLNTVPATAAARQPRGVVKIGAQIGSGTPVPGWISFEVTSNDYYEADTFRVQFAASLLPSASDANWFSQQTEIFVEVFAGFPSDPDHPTSNELLSLVYGRVDEIDSDPVTRLITVSGRDLTACFIDAKITSEWANQTSSEIATQLAQSHGLTPVVTATATPVGTYYKHDQVSLQADRSEWDMLAWLARQEGFVCYVTGQELHFEPDTRDKTTPYLIQWSDPADAGWPSANVQELSFSRALTVAKGISVTVRSASLTKKVAVVESYPAKAKAIQAGKASPFGHQQNYSFTMAPGATPVQAQQYAQNKYAEIIAHEMKMTARLPADNLLTTKTMIQVTGTGTAFDQFYYPNEIRREMNLDEGYTMTISAKNQSPDTQAAAAPDA